MTHYVVFQQGKEGKFIQNIRHDPYVAHKDIVFLKSEMPNDEFWVEDFD